MAEWVQASPEAIRDLREAFGQFKNDSTAAFRHLREDVQRVEEWLDGRVYYWAARVEQAELELGVAAAALSACEATAYHDEDGWYRPDCSRQEYRVKEAEEQVASSQAELRNTEEQQRSVRSAYDEFQSRTGSAPEVIERTIDHARADLDSRAMALDSFLVSPALGTTVTYAGTSFLKGGIRMAVTSPSEAAERWRAPAFRSAPSLTPLAVGRRLSIASPLPINTVTDTGRRMNLNTALISYLEQATVPHYQVDDRILVPLDLHLLSRSNPLHVDAELMTFTDALGENYARLSIPHEARSAALAGAAERLADLNDRAAGIRIRLTSDGICHLTMDLLLDSLVAAALAAAIERLAKYAAGFWDELSAILHDNGPRT